MLLCVTNLPPLCPKFAKIMSLGLLSASTLNHVSTNIVALLCLLHLLAAKFCFLLAKFKTICLSTGTFPKPLRPPPFYEMELLQYNN